MIKLAHKRKSCEGCKHHRAFSETNANSGYGCHYILDTGFKRPCSVENCTVKDLSTNQETIFRYHPKNKKSPLRNCHS